MLAPRALEPKRDSPQMHTACVTGLFQAQYMTIGHRKRTRNRRVMVPIER